MRRSAGRRPLRGRPGTVRVPGPGAMGRAGACRPAACGAADPDRLQLRTVLGPDAHDGDEDAGAVLRRRPGRRAPGPARFPAHVAGLDAAGRRGAAVDDARLPGPQPDRPGGGAIGPAPSGRGRGFVRHRRRAGLRRPAGRDAGLRPRWAAAGRARRVDRDSRGRPGDAGRAAPAPAGSPPGPEAARGGRGRGAQPRHGGVGHRVHVRRGAGRCGHTPSFAAATGQSQRIGHLLDIGQLTNQVILLSRE